MADLFGVVFVFLIVGFTGYRSAKKVSSVEDFTLAGGKINRIQAGFSMAANEFGGSSLIGAMAFCYTVGIAGIWWDWAAVPALILLGLFFAGKIKLPKMVTVTDFLEKRYDSKTRLLASIMHIIAIITQLSAQFLVGAVALEGIFGVPIYVGMMISMVFILLYTMAGGLASLVNTDIVQFVIVVLSLCIALPIAVKSAGGFAGIQSALAPEFLSFGNIDRKTVWSWVFFCFFTYGTSQHYMQLVFASKDKATARFAFLFTGTSYIIYGAIVGVIGVCILVLFPDLQDPNTGYTALIRTYMPKGIAGLVLGGIFAATISTADSMLLAASTLFTNDIYQPYIRKGRAQSEKEGLRAIRITTLFMCSGSFLVFLFTENIIDIMYLGGLFYSTAVFFPLLLGLYSKRLNATGAFVSILVSVIVGLISHLFLVDRFSGILGLPSNILAAGVSLLLLVVISLLTPPPKKEQLAFMQTEPNAE